MKFTRQLSKEDVNRERKPKKRKSPATLPDEARAPLPDVQDQRAFPTFPTGRRPIPSTSSAAALPTPATSTQQSYADAIKEPHSYRAAMPSSTTNGDTGKLDEYNQLMNEIKILHELVDVNNMLSLVRSLNQKLRLAKTMQ